MRLKCLLPRGKLDISSQETIEGEKSQFRLALVFGQIVTVPDELRALKNIDSAIRAGLLQVLDYSDDDGSLVVNAELKKPFIKIKLNDLADVNAPSPTDKQALVFDTASGMWIPGTAIGGGGGSLGSIYGLINYNISPTESPNGVITTFSLPDNGKYLASKISVYINGQLLNYEDFSENVDKKSVIFNSFVPKYGDNIRFFFVKDDPVYMDDFLTIMAFSNIKDSMVLNEIPIGLIDGSNRTFKLLGGRQFIRNKIDVMINGATLSIGDFIQDTDLTTITLSSFVKAPLPGDRVNLNYLSAVSPFSLFAFNESPQETPNGVNKTFSLDLGKNYISGKILVSLNGQVLQSDDFQENIALNSITLKSWVPAPMLGDSVRFFYLKPSV